MMCIRVSSKFAKMFFIVALLFIGKMRTKCYIVLNLGKKPFLVLSIAIRRNLEG